MTDHVLTFQPTHSDGIRIMEYAAIPSELTPGHVADAVTHEWRGSVRDIISSKPSGPGIGCEPSCPETCTTPDCVIPAPGVLALLLVGAAVGIKRKRG